MRKKAILDIGMEVLFLLQMAYHLIDPAIHEWIGFLLCILLVLHNLLDWKWYAGLKKGRYTAKRVFQTIMNLLLLISCIGLMISSVFLSPTLSGIFHLKVTLLGRRLHMVCTAWSFVLMSAHLGIHWNMVVGAVKKKTEHLQHRYSNAAKIIALLLSFFGAYAFWKRDLLQRMFFLSEYVFFDYSESLICCLMAYVSIQCLFVSMAYYLSRRLIKP